MRSAAHPDGMFTPMFQSTIVIDIDDLPLNVIIFGVAIAMMVLAIPWLRRITEVEPEIHSFRATAPAPPNRLLRAGVGLVIIAAALAAIALPR